jgi:hypothetical protein
MDGFAANGRIERTSPRLARAGSDRGDSHYGSSASERWDDVPELVDDRATDGPNERWATFRDRWSELTFYLFDPQSWR